MHLSRFARVKLTHAPTALEAMPKLSRQLGGPTLLIKRDDTAGLATGGNKTRMLEFLMFGCTRETRQAGLDMNAVLVAFGARFVFAADFTGAARPFREVFRTPWQAWPPRWCNK